MHIDECLLNKVIDFMRLKTRFESDDLLFLFFFYFFNWMLFRFLARSFLGYDIMYSQPVCIPISFLRICKDVLYMLYAYIRNKVRFIRLVPMALCDDFYMPNKAVFCVYDMIKTVYTHLHQFNLLNEHYSRNASCDATSQISSIDFV